MLCPKRREISLTVLLVNCHDVTGRIFDRKILRQTGMKSPLKGHNETGRKLLESLHRPAKTSRAEHRCTLAYCTKERTMTQKKTDYSVSESYLTLLKQTSSWHSVNGPVSWPEQLTPVYEQQNKVRLITSLCTKQIDDRTHLVG